MNPTLNKSDFEDLTTNLKDLAYSYLEKYNPSKQQLKVYLLKKYLIKIKGTKSKKEVTSLIDQIILNLEKNKLLNDEMYSDSKARMFLRRGYSLNKISPVDAPLANTIEVPVVAVKSVTSNLTPFK